MKIADEKAMIDRAQLRKMLEGFRLSKTKERDIEIAQDLAELFRKKSWLRNVFLPFGMNRFDGAVKELDGLDFGSEDGVENHGRNTGKEIIFIEEFGQSSCFSRRTCFNSRKFSCL
jgi:hypothetical protein